MHIVTVHTLAVFSHNTSFYEKKIVFFVFFFCFFENLSTLSCFLPFQIMNAACSSGAIFAPQDHNKIHSPKSPESTTPDTTLPAPASCENT